MLSECTFNLLTRLNRLIAPEIAFLIEFPTRKLVKTYVLVGDVGNNFSIQLHLKWITLKRKHINVNLLRLKIDRNPQRYVVVRFRLVVNYKIATKL